MGDCVRVTRGKTIRLRCETEGAAGCLLRIRSTEPDLEVQVREESFCHEWQNRIDTDTHFRVELWSQSEEGIPVMRALCNPIYVKTR